jgi:peptidoglycan/LPS O-acetylase OafA/YrhL
VTGRTTIRAHSDRAPDATRQDVNLTGSEVTMGYASARRMLTESGEIRPMTGVRGIAALAVVFRHFFVMPDTVGNALQNAYLAVDMFFMLSGLVLALNYASTVTLGAGRKPYFAFIQKRIARVFPLYIFVTVVKTAYDLSKHIGLGLAMPDTWTLKAMIANLFLVQAWGLSESAVGPAWSLSTELGAYILFPLLVALTIQSRTAVAWLVAILSGALLLAAAIGNSDCTVCTGYLDIFHGDTPYPLMRCVAGFTFGLIGYRLVNTPLIRAMVSANLFAILSVLGTLVAYFASLPDLVIYALLFATVMACFGNSKAANAMFGNRAVFFFGKISFSIYLVHILLAPVMKRFMALSDAHLGSLSVVMSASFAFVLVIAFSAASYYLVEMPGRRLALRLMSRKKNDDVAPSVISIDEIDAAR